MCRLWLVCLSIQKATFACEGTVSKPDRSTPGGGGRGRIHTHGHTPANRRRRADPLLSIHRSTPPMPTVTAMLRRLVRGLASPASATVSSSAIASSSATSRRALVTLAGRSSSNLPSSPIDALARRLSRIRLLPQVQRQQQQPLLALSTHARAAAAAPPPPPPPPPPSSSAGAAAAAALPPNLILADPEAVTAYRPVDLEAIERASVHRVNAGV